jgi:hypothetical protein
MIIAIRNFLEGLDFEKNEARWCSHKGQLTTCWLWHKDVYVSSGQYDEHSKNKNKSTKDNNNNRDSRLKAVYNTEYTFSGADKYD